MSDTTGQRGPLQGYISNVPLDAANTLPDDPMGPLKNCAVAAGQIALKKLIGAVDATKNAAQFVLNATATVGDNVVSPIKAADEYGKFLASGGNPLAPITDPFVAAEQLGEKLSSPQGREQIGKALQGALEHEAKVFQENPAGELGNLAGHAATLAGPLAGKLAPLGGAAKAAKAEEVATAVSRERNIRPTLNAGNIEDAIDRSIGGPGKSSVYETTEALKHGLAGERLAVDALHQQGHTILSFKPDISGTNKGGFDAITMKDGVVNFIDNKAYSTGKNIGNVSALDKNFGQNLAATRQEFSKFANDTTRTELERQLYRDAIKAIDDGRYQKVVTTAAIVPDGRHSTGISKGLADKGIQYGNVIPKP